MSASVYPTLPGLAWGVHRSPVWKTGKSETASGREFAVSYMTYPRYLYRLQYDFLRDTPSFNELQTLVGFFNLMRGSQDSFLFLDPDDNTAAAQQFGIGDGATTQFQLTRARGGFSEPVFDTLSVPLIYVAAALRTVGTHYTINATGVVTFVAAPTAGQALTWSGTYYWRCAFTTDSTEFNLFMRQLWEAKTVEFKTRKP